MPVDPLRGRRTVVYGFLDLGRGGAQRLTLRACRHLPEHAYRPAVVCARGGGALVRDARDAGLTVVEAGALRRRLDLAAVPRLAAILRDLAPSVVHVQLYSRSSPYLRLAARLAGVPLVVAHEWCRPSPPGRARAAVDRLLAPGTRFVAASTAQRRDLLRSGVPSERVTVIASGIEPADVMTLDRGEARRRLAAGRDRLVLGDAPVVLVPARLHPMKGHADLLAAVATAAASHPDLVVLCAGDGPLCGALRALASAAGLDAHVRFLGWREDVPLLVAASDVVALASHVEGLPAALMEAMAAGRPIVATAVGGVPELVDGDRTGWLVPPRAPRELAAALSSALADPAERTRRGAAGRRLVLERLTAARTAENLAAAYDRWLAEISGTVRP